MRPDEAAWLRYVVLESAPATLLAHFIARPEPPVPGTAAPWDEPGAYAADSDIRALLEEARLYSLVFEGAALLNSLLARAYEAHGFTRVSDSVDRYEREIDRWASEVEAEGAALHRLDPDDLVGHHTVVQQPDRPRHAPVRHRMDRAGAILTGETARQRPGGGASHRRPRAGPEAGRKLDSSTNGSSATGMAPPGHWLNFRWPTSTGIVTDVDGQLPACWRLTSGASSSTSSSPRRLPARRRRRHHLHP